MKSKKTQTAPLIILAVVFIIIVIFEAANFFVGKNVISATFTDLENLLELTPYSVKILDEEHKYDGIVRDSSLIVQLDQKYTFIVADAEVVAHLIELFLLLVFGQEQENIEDQDHYHEEDDGRISTSGRHKRLSFQLQNLVHYNVNPDGLQALVPHVRCGCPASSYIRGGSFRRSRPPARRGCAA